MIIWAKWKKRHLEIDKCSTDLISAMVQLLLIPTEIQFVAFQAVAVQMQQTGTRLLAVDGRYLAWEFWSSLSPNRGRNHSGLSLE